MSFKAIETQEEFDEAIKGRIAKVKEKALEEARADILEKYADYEDLKNQVSTLGQQLKDATEKASNYDNELALRDKQIADFQIKEIKTKVASETGLTLDAIQFLSGDSEETIRESANSLKSLVGIKAQPLAVNEPVAIKDKDYADMAKSLFK